jgi:hypothetical protein
MPQVLLPDLDDEDEEPRRTVLPPSPAARGKSLLKIGMEVALITAGVFLGLMGEEWRERAEQRELARTSLRRFRTEIANNQKAVAGVKDYHARLKDDVNAYFKLENRTPAMLKVRMTTGLGPVFFEQAAWDLALATGALTHVDSELAFALSRVYTLQQSYAGIQTAILQTTIYGRSATQDFEGFWRSLQYYFGDLSYFDPTILKAYDEVLARIDQEIGEPLK